MESHETSCSACRRVPWHVPWSYMEYSKASSVEIAVEYSMEFHGICREISMECSMERNGISWFSMECYEFYGTSYYSMSFHGISWIKFINLTRFSLGQNIDQIISGRSRRRLRAGYSWCSPILNKLRPFILDTCPTCAQ